MILKIDTMKVDEIIKSVNRGDFVVSNDNPHVIIKQGRKSRKQGGGR